MRRLPIKPACPPDEVMKYLAAAGGCAACGVSETRASGTWFSVHLCVTERVDMAGWRFAPGRHLRVLGNHSPAEGFGGETPPKIQTAPLPAVSRV